MLLTFMVINIHCNKPTYYMNMNKKVLWDYKTPGIPDEFFDRMDKVPITKEEIRSIIISKLRLKEGYRSIDIGCGSGSISIELLFKQKPQYMP